MRSKRVDPRDAAIEAEEAARFAGTIHAREPVKLQKGPKVLLVTAAQNNTHVHAGLWENLRAYAKHRDAKIIVSQFTYAKNRYGARDIKPGTASPSDYDDVWYAPEIADYVCNDRVAITPKLTFCGELNILPTAKRPLSGFENYTQRSSAIIPHAKQEMQSVASVGAAKFLYSTGVVTLRNYLERRAGQEAAYQHAYGALVVEIDDDGDFFCRQIRAMEDGSFQDLDCFVSNAKVTTGSRVEAISYGDAHVEQMDPTVRSVTWGSGGILDSLRPRMQFLHDTFDAYARSHHEAKNPHTMFSRWASQRESVRAELQRVADFLANEARREWCKTIVVDSNHDAALMRWLREADHRADPVNAEFSLQAQRMVYAALARGKNGYSVFGPILRMLGAPQAVRFLDQDESYVICKQAGGGIECGIHGHAGPNGSRGSPRAFSRLSRRVTTGHTHSAGIIGDCFTAGTSSILRPSYAKGPSSWSHSHVVAYPNGARAVVTIWKGKWRAVSSCNRQA